MTKPILYEANETAFSSNGLGRLSDAISCHVKETINSVYELEMVYPVKGIHFSDIKEHRYIYCPHDETGNPQPFEIYRISRPINGRVTVNASHISYKLNKMLVKPFTAEGLQDALQNVIPNNVIGGTMPFTFASDKISSAVMHIDNPVAIRSVMGGMQGSILDVYGGEWEYDHFTCTLRNRRGQDTGINIRYGKNLTDVNKTTDATNFWTGVVPYWRGNDPALNVETVVVYNGVIYSSVRNNYAYEMNVAVDASSAFQSPPTQAQLQTWGQTYVNNNARSGVPLSIKISFVQLWQTDEYKDIAPLQRLNIGDTVTVHYDELDVDNTSRIVGYDYNVLAERYDSMTVGDVQATLVSSITKEIEDVVKTIPSKSFFEAAIGRATELIKGGYGGYVVLNTNADGQPNEILVMNTPDKTTATRVMRINYQGIAFGTSYNGPFNSAWTTLDGTFDAQNINVINLSASSINTGYLSANRILGGTMKLGGQGNGNGKLEIYDESGNKIGTLDNNGADIVGNLKLKTPLWTGSGQYGYISGLRYDYEDVTQSSTSLIAEELKGILNDEVLNYPANDYALLNLYSVVPTSQSPKFMPGIYMLGGSLGGTTFTYTERAGSTAKHEKIRCDIHRYRYAHYWGSQLIKTFDGKLRSYDCLEFGYGFKKKLYDSGTDATAEFGLLIASQYPNGANIETRKTEIYYKDENNDKIISFTQTSRQWMGHTLSIDSSSSIRYKHDIDILMDKELDSHRLYDLPVRQFMYNDDAVLQYDDMRGQMLPGFIAEEVAEIYPSAVIHNPVTGEIESWDERRIIPGMLELIKEQKKKIDDLEIRLAKLENLVNNKIGGEEE